MNEFLTLHTAWAGISQWLASALQYMQAPYAYVELFSMLCALLGSLLLALKGKRAGWGWVLFAASNVGWIVFANGYGHRYMLLQQIGFSITSAIGIWQYLLQPAIERLFEHLLDAIDKVDSLFYTRFYSDAFEVNSTQESPDQSPVHTALPTASPRSKDARVRAVELLRESANELLQSHTVGGNGEWGTELDAKAAHDELLEVARTIAGLLQPAVFAIPCRKYPSNVGGVPGCPSNCPCNGGLRLPNLVKY